MFERRKKRESKKNVLGMKRKKEEQKQQEIKEKENMRKRMIESKRKKIERKRRSRGKYLQRYLYDGDLVSNQFNEEVLCIACGGRTTVLLYENGDMALTGDIPRPLQSKLYQEYEKPTPNDPIYIALGSNDRYYIEFSNGSCQWNGCNMMTALLRYSNRKIQTVAFGNDWHSFIIIYKDGWFDYCDIPDELQQIICTRGSDICDIDCVSIGPKGEYYLRTKDGDAWWGGMHNRNKSRINEIGDRVKFIDFADNDTYLCRYT